MYMICISLWGSGYFSNKQKPKNHRYLTVLFQNHPFFQVQIPMTWVA